MKMIRTLYNKVMELAQHHRAGHVLAGVSFAESSFFPIPPDFFLIPMILAHRERAWRYAALCTSASVIGGIVGYGIGWGLYEAVAEPILAFYGKMDSFQQFQDVYNEWGWWIVFFAGFTPFPFKVITIASGVTGLNFPLFILASFVSRAGRFYLVSALLWKYGREMKDFIERYLGLLTLLAFLFLFAGFYAVKFIF